MPFRLHPVAAISLAALSALSAPLACEPDREFDVSAAPPLGTCKLIVAPSSVDFGIVQIGTSATQAVTVENEGSNACSVTQLALDPQTDSQFTVSGALPVPFTLEPGASDPLVITFDATIRAAPHTRTGKLLVASDDPVTPAQSIPLTAQIDIGCDLQIVPNPLNFGNLALNITQTTPINISNDGTIDCQISGLGLGSGTDLDFALAQNQLAAITLAPGQSTAVPVTFDATSPPPNLRTGSVVFASNDTSHVQVTIPLQGYIDTTCTAASQLIYTVDSNAMLASFDPNTLTFTNIGQLNCPTESTTFSMGVDQEAIAWVEYDSGEIFRVDTRDASCTATSFQPGQDSIVNFGMGFLFNPNTGIDTLYIAGADAFANGPSNTELGTISFPDLTVHSIGPVSIGWPEFTGTGDGQLWGFVPGEVSTSGVSIVAQLDPATGATIRSFSYPEINNTGGWAMKFFGGSFWIFLGNSVYAVSRDTAALRLVIDGTSPEVVGAGVSTCAPLH